MDDTQAIISKLDTAGAMISAKDMAIIDELWSDGFQLIGSEEGEIAVTHDELVALVSAIFSAPFTLRWVWDSRSVTIETDIGWVFAQGHLYFIYPDKTDEVSYRLVAIFRRVNDDWKWRLYSGSEPMAPRPL